MNTIKSTDVNEERIEIGKSLYESKLSSYPAERVRWMYKTIENLATDDLKSKFSNQDLFYLSIYDYWVYGNTISEEIYFHFPVKSHEEKKEYMTFRSRLKYMKRINNWDYSHVFNNKYETYLKYKDYYLRDVTKIESEDNYTEFVDFVKKHPVFVVKPTSSHIGIGVKKIVTDKDSDLRHLFLSMLKEGNKNSKDCFENDTSFLLEELIEQVDDLARIHPYSVNGIRVTTYKNGKDVKILYPWFKVGANKSFVTSAAFGTYDAGIDPESGFVVTDGFKENGEFDVSHPLTGIRFKGYQIPQWQDLIGLVKQLSFVVPEVNYVGWDMVLTQRGWCIMEANFTGDFMWQMFNQKGFKKEFVELTGIQNDEEFWWQ